MALRTGFDFQFMTLPTTGLDDLRPYYDRLPLDPYIKGQFRRRRFAHFLGRAATMRRLPHMQFVQAPSINHVFGGVRREFQEIEESMLALPAFRLMVDTFIDFTGIDPDQREYGVHQIRILCTPEFKGIPAPEGIHQDGFDYVGIFCVARRDIVGAATRVYPARDQPPVFSRELQPGETVFVNDRTMFHFAEAIRPTTDHEGDWDLIVITA